MSFKKFLSYVLGFAVVAVVVRQVMMLFSNNLFGTDDTVLSLNPSPPARREWY